MSAGSGSGKYWKPQAFNDKEPRKDEELGCPLHVKPKVGCPYCKGKLIRLQAGMTD